MDCVHFVVHYCSILFIFNLFFSSAIPVLGILFSIPWILPWSEINVPYLPTFHVVASVSPWIGSTMYHLFMNHNTGEFAYKMLLTIDLLGIWVTQTAGKHYNYIHYLHV